MEKEIEKAIRETLVISNPQSINIAVKKILLLFSGSGSFSRQDMVDFADACNGDYDISLGDLDNWLNDR